MRAAARLMRSASATDVPPNFMTTVPVNTRKVSPALAALLAAVALVSCGGGGEVHRDAPLQPAGKPELGLPVEAAVAQLFAVGFPGTGAKAPIVARLRERDWGVVVLTGRNTTAPAQARALV